MSHQLGNQGTTQQPGSSDYRSKCFVTPFRLVQILREKCSIPLGISKTTKAYPWAWKCILFYYV